MGNGKRTAAACIGTGLLASLTLSGVTPALAHSNGLTAAQTAHHSLPLIMQDGKLVPTTGADKAFVDSAVSLLRSLHTEEDTVPPGENSDGTDGTTAEGGTGTATATDGTSSSGSDGTGTNTADSPGTNTEDSDGNGPAAEDAADELSRLLTEALSRNNPNQLPDPLDFDNQQADPITHLIPAAADRFKQADGSYNIGRPAPGGPGAGNAVAGLEEFYEQKITWGDCGPFDPSGAGAYASEDVECGYLIVPVDYKNPGGATAAIALMKVKAKNPDARIGSIFMDPGGPGGSGVERIFDSVTASSEVRDKFDLIGFDPRGVSSSLPMIRCKSSAAFDAQRQGSDMLTAAQRDKVLEQNTAACYENTGKGFGIAGADFIPHVGTINVIKDLDIARAAVGDNKINYLGYSYGTSIGYQYAMEFPDNIRTMVLDAVVNPFENNPEEAAKYAEYTATTSGTVSSELSQIQGFQSTFEQFLLKCAAEGFEDTPCALGTSTDLNTLMAEYQKLSQKAWGSNVYKGRDGRVLSFEDFTQATILSMYSESFWKYLNIGLTQIKNNNNATMMLILADIYYSRDSKTNLYSYSDSAFQTIWCTDSGTSPDGNDPAAATALTQEQYKVAPFTDPGKNEDGTQRGLEPSKDWCTFYKNQHTLPQGKTLKAMPNILFISTSYDPSTPYQDGVVAAAGAGGTLLSVAGNDHAAYDFGADDCVAQITNRYFVDIVVPTDITGPEADNAKDLYSNVINGTQCRVDSFRATTAAADVTTGAGSEVEITATGLVRNTAYDVELPAGFTLATPVVANVDGTATFTVKVPANAAAQQFTYTVKPADAAANDPVVQVTGKINVVAQETPVTPEQNTTATKPVAQGKAGGKQPLAKTGADFGLGAIALAAIALAATGAGVAARARRRG